MKVFLLIIGSLGRAFRALSAKKCSSQGRTWTPNPPFFPACQTLQQQLRTASKGAEMNFNIKAQRERFGLSQMELARLARVSRFRLHLYERGDLCLREDEVARIRLALTRTVERLQEAITDFDGAA